MSECPCGSGLPLAECCGPMLSGHCQPATAEALMRSRYTAYTLVNVAYLQKTSAPALRKKFDEKATREWASASQWSGLQIIKTTQGGPDDATGKVEFIARYTYKESVQEHHEVASFIRGENQEWLFEDGMIFGHDPIRRVEPKTGRNDPCPCGSGLKFKKCCAHKNNGEQP